MINVRQHNNEYIITFKYDPNVVDIVRDIPGRRWDPNAKCWILPADKLGWLINAFRGTIYESSVVIQSEEDININTSIDPTTKIPEIDISKIPFYVKSGSSPYKHQLDFMKFSIYRQLHGNLSGYLLADDMGCISGYDYVDVKMVPSSEPVDNQPTSMYTLRELYRLFRAAKEINWYIKCWAEDKNQFVFHRMNKIIYVGNSPVYKISCGSTAVRATIDHPILTKRGYVEVENLLYDDVIATCTADGVVYSNIESVEYIGYYDVYDIQMAGPYHNFVVNDIVVHNCGKSLEITNLAIYNKKQYKYNHCLILCCVNSSKYNWQKDIQDHTEGLYEGYIIGSRLKRNGDVRCDTGSKEKLDDLVTLKKYGKTEDLPYFLIMNIESVRYQVGKKYPIADRIIQLINDGTIGMVAIDEVHKNVSPSSKQGKQIQRIKRETKTKAMWMPMTGTPITNKPTDVFLPLYLTDSHRYSSYYSWCKEFCIYGGFGDHEIVGYKNIPKLKSMLQGNMLRRMKSDVLDLPPKIYYTRYVDNTPYQQKLYDEIRDGLLRNKDKILSTTNPLAQFLRLRQVNGSPELIDSECKIDSSYVTKNAKLIELLNILDEIHERGEKVVVFSNWVEPLRTLYRVVSKKYKICAFTGTMSDADKEKNKQVFLTNPNYTVLLGTIGAAGTTHTFTSANNLIFYDSPWNPSDKNQASDRIYRIGTTQSVNIYTLVTRNTVDERVQDILYTKEGTANYIVDNKLDLRNNPNLFDMLLR